MFDPEVLKSVSITIYALKSKRKNAKCECKKFSIFPESKNLKEKFTNYDYSDLQEWCFYMVNTMNYKYFQFVVHDGLDVLADGTNIWRTIHDFCEVPITDIVKLCETVKRFFDLYNSYTKRKEEGVTYDDLS